MSQLRFFLFCFFVAETQQNYGGNKLRIVRKKIAKRQEIFRNFLKLYRNYAKFPGFFGNFQEFSEHFGIFLEISHLFAYKKVSILSILNLKILHLYSLKQEYKKSIMLHNVRPMLSM